MKLEVKYMVFAVIATVVNIASQDLSFRIYSGDNGVLFSVIVGTAVGLIVKYILDKKYIFFFQVKNVSHDTQVFFLYTIMGLFTTVIFWGFEFFFDYVFMVKEMRYLGGVIGLLIGYYIKYQLDKRFVFVVKG